MIDKILKARLSQLKEFKLKAEQHIELLQVRVSELTDEENLLNALLNLYSMYNPDPTATSDKIIDDIIKENPKRTKFTISSELADALAKLEEHKKEKLEMKIKQELEIKLRKELEPQVREELKQELSETISQVQHLVSIVNDTIQIDIPKEKSIETQKVIIKKHTKSENKADYKKIQQDIKKFILDNGNRYMTVNEIADYLNINHSYLNNIWKSIKKGTMNVLFRMEGLDIKKADNGRKNLYRIKIE